MGLGLSGLRDVLDEMVSVLRDALDDVDVDIQVERGMVLNPSPPTVDVYVSDPARDFTAAGFGDIAGGYQVTVRARVLTADNDAGQDLLISFLDDEDDLCLPLLLFADPTLNGKATSMDLVAVSGHRAYETPEPTVAHLGAQWDFIVTAVRS
jgi:hypothetical protein